jgi:hypothetical protein
MAQGLTQPITKMSTRNFTGGKGDRQGHRADNFIGISEPNIYKICKPRRLITAS